MQNTPQPREHRIAYAAGVRLSANDVEQPCEGQTINLSRSGLLLECQRSFVVGTEIHCELPLADEPLQLRGRISRVETLADDRVRLAVQFVELGEPELGSLSRLLRETGGAFHLVRVRFEGMPEPMRARAVVTEQGIHLSTSLSFLRLRSRVDVTFPAGSDWAHTRGRVMDVHLDRWTPDGVPRLAVQLARTTETPAPLVMPANELESRGRWPWLRAAAGVALGLGATVLVAVLLYGGPDTAPRPQRAQREIVTLPPASLGRTSSPISATPAPSVATGPATTAINEPLAQPAPTSAAITDPQSAKEAELPSAPVIIPLPLPPGTPGPEIQRAGRETTARVALTGSTSGMSHYSLGQRRGLAVNLPHAGAAVPLGLHRVGHDGLAYVWIRQRHAGGLHVRFIFTSPAPDERLLELEEDALRIRIRLPAPALGEAAPVVAPRPEPQALEEMPGADSPGVQQDADHTQPQDGDDAQPTPAALEPPPLDVTPLLDTASAG